MSKSDTYSPTSSNFGRKGWGVVLLSFFSIMLMSSIVYDSLNVTVAAFAQKLGTPVSVLYIFSTIAAWISVLGAVLWGIICTKKTIRFAWAASLVLGAIACALWGFAPSSPVYFVCLAIASVAGMGFAYIANLNVISNWFPTKKGLVMGWVTIGFPLSASISTPLCAGILGAGGLPTLYLVYMAACVVLAVLVAVFVRDYPEQAGAFPDNNRNFDKALMERQLKAGLEYQKTSVWQPKKLIKTGNLWLIAFSLGVMELLSLGIMTNFVPRMMQIGYQLDQVTPMLAIAGLVACFGSYLCGVLDAKVGPKKAIFITFFFGIFSLGLNLVGGVLKQRGPGRPRDHPDVRRPALPRCPPRRRGQLPCLPDQHDLGTLRLRQGLPRPQAGRRHNRRLRHHDLRRTRKHGGLHLRLPGPRGARHPRRHRHLLREGFLRGLQAGAGTELASGRDIAPRDSAARPGHAGPGWKQATHGECPRPAWRLRPFRLRAGGSRQGSPVAGQWEVT